MIDELHERAQIIDDKHKHAYLWRIVRERFLDSLVFVPLLFILLALLLAVIVRRFDLYLIANMSGEHWFFGKTAALISVTSVISASMLTFVAVVFSVTLVGLQMASQQFSPRVMRTFVRSKTVKFSAGVFVAAFVFSMVVLSESVRRSETMVPLTSLIISMGLVFLSLVILFVFVKTLVNMIRVAYVITIIADETRASIGDNLPPSTAYHSCAKQLPGKPCQVITYERPPETWLSSRIPQGVLQGVNINLLLQLAVENNLLIRVLPRIGDYITGSTAVVEVYGNSDLDRKQVLSAFAVGQERTLFQDPAFGFRQLVDIAVLALSPGAAAPTTASQAIYRITDLLREIAERPEPTGYYADQKETIRLICPATNWQKYVDLAFTEIIDYGALSSQVGPQLEHAFTQLIAQVPPDHRPPLLHQQQRLQQLINANKKGSTVIQSA